MGRKSKIKNESQKEVKIYFSDYASSILLQWREKLNVNEKTANELIGIAKKIIKEIGFEDAKIGIMSVEMLC